MHLGDERAGGVDLEQLAKLRRLRHRFRHAMGGEDHRAVAIGDLVELVDEDGALGLEVVDHEFIVHDLMAHIDGCAVEGHGAHHAGAEAARRRQQNGQGRLAHEG